MSETATLEEAVDEFGPLIETAPKFEPSSIWIARQINRARRTEQHPQKRESLRNTWYRTDDSSLYKLDEKGRGRFYLGRGLIINNLADAVSQLRRGNYSPSEEVAETFEQADTTTGFFLSDIRLKGNNPEYGFLEINTTNGGKNLSSVERMLAEIPFGRGDEFEAYIEELARAGKDITGVFILKPEYVKEHAAQRPIARAGGLDGFGGDSRFDAGDRDVDVASLGLRGVLRKSAEGAPQNDYVAHLNAVLRNPIPDERVAAALLGKVNEHYNPKKA